MKITAEFGGGMETLFGGQKEISLDLPKTVSNIQDLLFYLKEHHVKGHPELFMQGSTIRPGVLILINEADWELEGGLKYKLTPADRILFISTLHGGLKTNKYWRWKPPHLFMEQLSHISLPSSRKMIDFDAMYRDLYQRVYLGQQREESLLPFTRIPCNLANKIIYQGAKLVIETWEADHPSGPLNTEERLNRIQEFADELGIWIHRVQPSALAYISALIFMYRLSDVSDYSTRGRRCATNVFGTALLIAYKYFDLYARGQLSSQPHEEWAEMLSPDMTGYQLMQMECDFINLIDEKLVITTEFVEEFLELGYLNGGAHCYGVVPGSLEVLLTEVSESGQPDEDAAVPVFIPEEAVTLYDTF